MLTYPLSAGAASASGRIAYRRLGMGGGELSDFSTEATGFALHVDGRGREERTPKSEGNAG